MLFKSGLKQQCWCFGSKVFKNLHLESSPSSQDSPLDSRLNVFLCSLSNSPNAAAHLETSCILEMFPSVNSYLTWKHYGDELMRVYSIYECKFCRSHQWSMSSDTSTRLSTFVLTCPLSSLTLHVFVSWIMVTRVGDSSHMTWTESEIHTWLKPVRSWTLKRSILDSWANWMLLKQEVRWSSNRERSWRRERGGRGRKSGRGSGGLVDQHEYFKYKLLAQTFYTVIEVRARSKVTPGSLTDELQATEMVLQSHEIR